MRQEPRAGGRRLRFAPLPLGDPGGDHAHTLPAYGGVDYAPKRVADGPLECLPVEDGTEDPTAGVDNQFTIRNGWEACFRTLWHNAPPNARHYERRRRESMLGPYGHIERMNAWTHVVGALAFAVFSFLRAALPATFDNLSTAGQLSAVSAAATVVTFTVSTAYHSYAGVRALSPAFRVLDHGIILCALAVASATDACVATLNYADARWQTVAEPFFIAVTLLIFFSYRRLVLDVESTELAWGDCSIGLFRVMHADFDASPFRTAGYVAIGFLFVQLIPVTYRNLLPDLATLLIVANGIGLLVLAAGLVLDNVAVVPDLWYERRAAKRRRALPGAPGAKDGPEELWFHNRRCGCLCTAHAWWHVAALVATIVQGVGREYVISSVFLES